MVVDLDLLYSEFLKDKNVRDPDFLMEKMSGFSTRKIRKMIARLKKSAMVLVLISFLSTLL